MAKKQNNSSAKTGLQTASFYALSPIGGMAELAARYPATIATYRNIRKQPVVALARAAMISMVTSADWSIEADEDVPIEHSEYIRAQIAPYRDILARTVMEQQIDYGWAGFEKVLSIGPDGLWNVQQVKPLLVDLTTILVDPATGAFAGLRQVPTLTQPRDVLLDVNESMIFSFRGEAGNPYGTPLLENIRLTYAAWMEVQASAERYDRKLAGSIMVLRYPVGKSADGQTDNQTVAQSIGQSVQSSGLALFPNDPMRGLKEPGATTQAWSIDIVEAHPAQGSYCERLRSLESLLVRGLLFPERAILEGQYGTKAESESQGEFAVNQAEADHRAIVSAVNEQLIDPLLVLSYGESARGTVRMAASPMTDRSRTIHQGVFAAILQNPIASTAAIEQIDIDALMDNLNVPKLKQIAEQDDPGIGDDAQSRLQSLYRQAFEDVNGRATS